MQIIKKIYKLEDAKYKKLVGDRAFRVVLPTCIKIDPEFFIFQFFKKRR